MNKLLLLIALSFNAHANDHVEQYKHKARKCYVFGKINTLEYVRAIDLGRLVTGSGDYCKLIKREVKYVHRTTTNRT